MMETTVPPKKQTRSPWAWLTDQNPWVKTIAALSVIGGFITLVPGVFNTMATPVASYVDGRVDIKIGPMRFAFDTTSTAVRDLQIENAQGKLEATNNAMVNWQVELKKTKEQTTRELINRQMRELEVTRGRLEEQVRTLNAIRNKGNTP
jgi:hypothetical protein